MLYLASYHEGVCYIIDVTQALPVAHKDALDMLYADVDNVSRFFAERGCAVLPYDDAVALITTGSGAAVGTSTPADVSVLGAAATSGVATPSSRASALHAGGASDCVAEPSSSAHVSFGEVIVAGPVPAVRCDDEESDPAEGDDVLFFLPEDVVKRLSPFLQAVVGRLVQ